MCREETMMRISGIEAKLLDMLDLECAKGLENVNADEMGEVVDMLKDLAEAKYYCSVVMAMEEPEEGPMGYNARRYASGRYAPKGRGSMGYRDGMWQGEAWEPMGYQSARDDAGGPMGATPAVQGGSQPMGYGTAYDRYRRARMGYQQSRTAENRRGMDEAANEHVREFTDSMQEMWADADQSQRTQMRNALVKFVNDLK